MLGQRPVGAARVRRRGAGQVPGRVVEAGPGRDQAVPERGLVGPEVALGRAEVERPERRRGARGAGRPPASARRRRAAAASVAGPVAACRRSPTLASSWSPSSTVRRNAAQTASDSTVRSRPTSSSWSAAARVPPGDVTMFRSSAGCIPDCFANSVLPSSVSMTRSWATWRGKPRWTAASMSASMTRKTYVGPVPLTAVAIATIFSSSTSSWAPSAPSRAAACARCVSVVSGVAYQTVMPLPSRAGVFGMLRTTWSWPRMPVSAAVVAPARTLSTSWPRRRCGPISRPTLRQHLGLDPEQDDVRAVGPPRRCRRRSGCRTRARGARAARRADGSRRPGPARRARRAAGRRSSPRPSRRSRPSRSWPSRGGTSAGV